MPAQSIRPLILALGVALGPLVFALPWWVILWCLGLWGYSLIRGPSNSPIPSRAARIIIFCVGFGLVLLSAGMRFDGSDFIALLAVMAGIKPLELRGYRDSMVTVFLAYFLVITSLFVFENLSMTVYLFVSVWVTTAVLMHVNHPHDTLHAQMKFSARMVITAIPLMTILFLIFPRSSGNYLGVPWIRQGRTGFSSAIRMGDVSRLVVMDAPAFSVTFDTAPPEPGRRYWRGIVFQDFDGETWTPVRHQSIRRGTIHGETVIRYEVILEPHGHRNLFALDLPIRAEPKATIMDDHTLRAKQTIQQRLVYTAMSILDYRPDGTDPPGQPYLQLPPDRNPRTAALGRQLSRIHAKPEARVHAGLKFFRHQGFTYTLRPDRLGRDAVDDFLFVSRNGFCEHFAGAFTVLMRSAGVPARMVGGYQGGRWNRWGDFLTVRQADAHVWCEVWLGGQGWVRVDPTAEVAPERIDGGIDGLVDGLPGASDRVRDHLLSRWIEHARLTWEAVNIHWNMWFMGFSAADQIALLKTMTRWWSGVRWGLVPLGLMIAVFYLLRRQRRAKSATIEDQALIAYHRFLKKMSRIGSVKPPWHGAWDFSQTVIRRHPALEAEVCDIVARYLALRYGREQTDDALKTLQRRVRRFHP